MTVAPVVSAEWVAEHLAAFQSDEPTWRLVEVDIEPTRYEEAHIPGAVVMDWQSDLQDTERFDVLSPDSLEALLGEAGITPETAVVLYGDFHNWFAAHAYWLLRYYRHERLYLLDGGRKYWLANSLPTTAEAPSFSSRTYEAGTPDRSIRADSKAVERALGSDACLVDVRAPPEYRGEILAPPGWNEGVQRGGHIPGAQNVPWSRALRPDGRFRPRDELAEVYARALETDDEVILYCRIGERSAHTWFVLHELLERETVRHYYGSWVEWGNTVGLPVERDAPGELR